MPRMRLDPSGFKIAKAGFDVDTASLANMIFTTDLAGMQLRQTGVVTVAAYSGYLDTSYRRAVVNFGTTYAQPPLVLAAGIVSSTESDQFPWYWESYTAGGPAIQLPWYSIETYTNRFELYVLNYRDGFPDRKGSPATQWRYFVFAHALSD